ncbi:MAG: PilZ domain-containing protein [Thermoanaerobaculia bacterium]|nr:PilZ domain-containing protein [Thermoanaerobaculia bacterium]
MNSSTSESSSNGSTVPERRTSVRLLVQLDATIDDGEVARMCRTENLSKSGMLVRTRAPLPVGTDVAVQFLFPGDPAVAEADLPGGYAFVEGRARVVRHTDPSREPVTGMALHFMNLEEHGKRLLHKFLDERQRPEGPGKLGFQPS